MNDTQISAKHWEKVMLRAKLETEDEMGDRVCEPYNLTNEEAINAIEKNMPLAGTYTVLTEALHMAIKALRKQEPMKPEVDEEIRTLEKPCEWCEGNVSKYFDTNWYDFTAENTGVRPKAKFCPNCGRKLDWGDTK